MDTERLQKQLDFLLEADKLKNIYRQTYIINDTDIKDGKPVERQPRKENDSEHSFHLALFAAILSEYSNEPVDILHVMKMVLIHDIVEIDAGDTYCYDAKANETKRKRELAAADRLFGLLPEDQCEEFRALWDEFEECATPEAKFANCMDRAQPLLLNCAKGGIGWTEHDVRYSDVISRNGKIADGAKPLWDRLKPVIDEYHQKGTLK